MKIDYCVCPDRGDDPFTAGWHGLLWCINVWKHGKKYADKKWEKGWKRRHPIPYPELYPELYEACDKEVLGYDPKEIDY